MSTQPTQDKTIEMHPVFDDAGNVVWTHESIAGLSGTARPDLASGASGIHVRHPSGETATDVLSVLPHERMAGSPEAWADIVKNLRAAEDGQPHAEVVLRPGGTLEVSRPGDSPRPLSRIPEERMAARNPEPVVSDAAEVIQIDPHREESWEPLRTGLLNGWKFRLRPEPGADDFVFFAFRNPSDANAYRLFVVKPDVDHMFGHGPHMIHVTVGGQEIPVLCGPAGRAARTLAEARAQAGKWMTYTYRLKVLCVDPGFSV
jgi:hypothetical protein